MVRASKTVSVVFLLAVGVASAADDAYHRHIEQDRRETDEFLRSEKSPLLLIGRFSVNEGSSTLGSDPASTIVLPTRAPQHLGTIFRHGNQFTFEVMMGTSVSLNGKPASGPFRLQVADISKQTDRVSFGDFKFRIRQVGDSFDLLLSDTQSPFLKKFKGTTWFPIDPVKRVAAQFIPAEQKKDWPWCRTRTELPKLSRWAAIFSSNLMAKPCGWRP